MVPDLNGCAASFFPFKMVLAVGLSCIFSSIIRYVSPEANSLKFKRKINNKCCQFPVSFYCSHKWFMVWLVFICLFLCVDLWLSTWLIPTTPHILPCHSFACCKIAIATGCKGSVPWPLSLCTHQKLPCSRPSCMPRRGGCISMEPSGHHPHHYQLPRLDSKSVETVRFFPQTG